MTEKVLLKPIEVAQATGLSRTKVYDLIARGDLPHVKVGGLIRVPVKALREWADKRTKTKAVALLLMIGPWVLAC